MLRRLLPAALVPILLLAACGDDDDGDAAGEASSSTTTEAVPIASSDLDAIVVVPGAEGEPPTLEFEQPFGVEATERRVLEAGDGEAAAEGSSVEFDFVFVNARDGSEVSSSFDIDPAVATIDDALLPGVRIGLTGVQAGERSLVAIAPADGFAGQGDDEASGVRESDTLLLYLEVHEVRTPLQRAEGTSVEPPEGLPTVTLDDAGAPTIEVPAGDPPAELVSQLLIEGQGPVVEAGQSITVHYTGVLWDGGEQFDSSWDRGTPATFGIGVQAVIAGWDEGLVGQTVGSQVLLVIPADKGYGDRGSGSIPAGSTLVFVVDILDAR